jgi:hypothetical protein
LEPRPARTSSLSRTFPASLPRRELYLLQCNSSLGSLQRRCLRSLLSATMKIPLCFQSGPYSWSVLHSASALAPIAVPIHRLPSRAPSRELMRGEGSSFPPGGLHETNRTPSNRVNPAWVPIQRYPSVVCAIAFGVPAKTPSPGLRYWRSLYGPRFFGCSFGKSAINSATLETKRSDRFHGGGESRRVPRVSPCSIEDK